MAQQPITQKFSIYHSPIAGLPGRSYTPLRSDRKRRTYAKIMSALENYRLSDFRFLTVTTSPESPQSQDIEGLRLAWKEFVRRMRRKYGVFEYIAVVEQNKKENLLHIHALIRSPYIPQSVLSSEWKKITKAYVVFVTALYLEIEGKRLTGAELDRLNDNQKREIKTKVAAYITKYLTKSNKKLQSRVWVSRRWSERWNFEKRMYQIGMDLERRIGTEKIWWQAWKDMIKRESKYLVRLEWFCEGIFGFNKVEKGKILIISRDAYETVNWKNYVVVSLFEDGIWENKIMRKNEFEKMISAENVDDDDILGWWDDAIFWTDLVYQLESQPNAPPA